MEQFQMPEFAVVGNTAYVRAPYRFDSLRKVTITKVLKRQVVVQWEGQNWLNGESTAVTREARFSVENYGKRLKEIAAGKDNYRKDELISEEEGLKTIERKAVQKTRLQARTRVENVSYEIAKRVRNCNMETLDALMNELKTSVEELRELEK